MLREFTNRVSFTIRSKYCMAGFPYCPTPEDKADLAIPFEQQYYEKYNLQYLKQTSTVRNYLENLYILELLEKYLPILPSIHSLYALDIGSKNFFYASGMQAFYSTYFNAITLTGIELDAYRLYTDFRSRYSYAQYYIKNLPATSYVVGDIMNLDYQNHYHYITWLFPFVLLYPLIAWGLPSQYFRPEEMLLKAITLLKTPGYLLIVNQGLDELEEQTKLLERIHANYRSFKEPFESSFLKYNHQRYITVVSKEC